jgi:predicted nucleic acid-binding protein
VIVADTSALIALVAADDKDHDAVLSLWEATARDWVVPWATLPETDFMLRTRLGTPAARLFLADLAGGKFMIEHSQPSDIARAAALDARYAELGLGLVDGAVIAVAERLRATAIATFDLRHFGALDLPFKLLPRDL